MASVCNDGNGRRRILVVAPDGRRVPVRLGRCSARQAESAKLFIEDLAACRVSGGAPKGATAEWLAGLPEAVHRRLVKAGLAQPRARRECPTLGAWLETCIAGRTDLKPNSVRNMRQAQKALAEHFGDGRLLDEITPADADAFRIALKARGLAEATVRRTCKRARQFFGAAIRAKLIEDNTFAGVPCGDFANESRRRFIAQEDIERVIEKCPLRWQVLFGLARFGGLRIPSEARLLRWADVLWAENRLVVSSPKTAGQGKASRIVPLFPRLREILLTAFEAAEPGAEYVAEVLRDGRENPRTVALRYIRRAGLEPWPRLFQNLRASLESELVSSFPVHTVTRWLGNTPAVAMAHYLTDRPEDFDRAAEWRPDSAAQKAAHFPAQYPAATGRREAHGAKADDEELAICGALQSNAAPCDNTEPQGIPPRGVEPLSPG